MIRFTYLNIVDKMNLYDVIVKKGMQNERKFNQDKKSVKRLMKNGIGMKKR